MIDDDDGICDHGDTWSYYAVDGGPVLCGDCDEPVDPPANASTQGVDNPAGHAPTPAGRGEQEAKP